MHNLHIFALMPLDRSPGQRFRFEQYLKAFPQAGFRVHFHPLLTVEQASRFYSTQASPLTKIQIVLSAQLKRYRQLKQVRKGDIALVYREMTMLGFLTFEKMLKARGVKFLHDFDDAIWIKDVSAGNRLFAAFKNTDKIKDIIRMADIVTVGNQYLADYAKQHNPNTQILPVVIDTDEYHLVPNQRSSDYLTIGWSGSITTIQHFEHALPFLRPLKQKYGDQIRIKVIGDGNYRNEALGIQGLAWSKEAELRELSSFDIGIMPLPNDPWAKGKCGLKGLQYMALEIPTLMSPVGINADIIQDGVNGYLATEVDEWVQKIEYLIEHPEARLAMGRAGRQTVLDEYSVHANREKYLDAFRSLL